jgi:hypothetical protein
MLTSETETEEAVTLLVDRMGAVEVRRFRGDKVTVRGGAPLPPGTRTAIRQEDEERPLAEGKVTSVDAVQDSDATWDVDLKLFSPSKKAKALFASLAESSSSRAT